MANRWLPPSGEEAEHRLPEAPPQVELQNYSLVFAIKCEFPPKQWSRIYHKEERKRIRNGDSRTGPPIADAITHFYDVL